MDGAAQRWNEEFRLGSADRSSAFAGGLGVAFDQIGQLRHGPSDLRVAQRERRAERQDVSSRAAAEKNDALTERALHDANGSGRVRPGISRPLHEFDAEHQAAAAHVAHER